MGLGAEPDRLLPLFDSPTVWLRLLHYPRRPKDAPADQYGSAPHTDFGCLTLLFEEGLLQDAAGGLEVQAADGAWIAAPPVEGALLVNTGDIVPVWSGGRWRSTPHRVVNPPDRDRYSIAWFYDPSLDATIAPLDGAERPAPFRYGDHVMAVLADISQYRRFANAGSMREPPPLPLTLRCAPFPPRRASRPAGPGAGLPAWPA